MARDQEQFLEVVDRDEAERRWRAALPGNVRLGAEEVALDDSLGRVLAADVLAGVDVPGFDRSNVDGFAVRAEDTFGASDERPRVLRLNEEELATGCVPGVVLGPGTATLIATGAMVPRGADAVVMVEQTGIDGAGNLLVRRPVAPGAGLSFAGTDMARGELVLRRGTLLTSRETGVLAAIGQARVSVSRRVRVAILSTGDELRAPGEELAAATTYDSNATILAHAVRELGGEPIGLGIVPDDEAALTKAVDVALESADVVLLSGGTSKGAGDLSYRVLKERTPGILVHGVALKPGKPICLGAVGEKAVAILPGFPTSAVFTFHEFVAPLIREWAGIRVGEAPSRPAIMRMRVNSEPGRTEYVLVNLVEREGRWTAYPIGKGSGSVTTFSRADGFVVIGKRQEYLEAGETVQVVPLGRGVEPADLLVVGSHCAGLDWLLGELGRLKGFTSKTMWVGSQGGLMAAGRGECDVAGVHLLDPVSGRYNEPFLPEGTRLLPGYGRMQGVVYRAGDARFLGKEAAEAVEGALADGECLMVNRNRGSGTRLLIDGLLGTRRPGGHAVEARSHNAVAVAVAQGRADWGLAIEPVARLYGLGFLPLRAEQYDFVVPATRWERPAVAAFRALLESVEVREGLAGMGFART